MKAVVFDLFGTLVTYPSGSPHVRAMAERLGVSFDLLRAAWRRLRAQRDAGELDTQAALRICCNELGIDRSDQDIEAACAEVVEFFRAVLSARDGAISTLTALRTRHLRIGLVSDANLEVAKLWSSTTLAPLVDAAVFSCEEHVRKPDPTLYRAVCERLGVAASDCLYVGNGDGQELAGALTAGMRGVLFTAPGEIAGREAADWTGDHISSLAQVLPFTLVSVTVR